MNPNRNGSTGEPGGAASAPPGWPGDLAYRAWRMRTVRAGLIALGLLTVFGVGRMSGPGRGDASAGSEGAASAPDAVQAWTCSMHPQIRLPKFAQCPICFMDLVPVRAGGGDDGDAARARLSARARELARVETVEVAPREIRHNVRMVGKVAVDETRITYISSYIPGRLDRLFVDYTGILVRKGDHLAEIYSPELLIAQREYLLALEAAERARAAADGQGGPLDEPRGSVVGTVLEAARRKLELWGVPRDEIGRLDHERVPSDHMRIDSPVEGWVLERKGYQGMYVETGTRLFTVVELQRVWVLLDAYELDVAFLRYGQPVEFETESFSGRKFRGQVAYIDPVLNEATRTVKVRVNVENNDLQLRPGMFVRASVESQIGEGGAVVNNALAGQFICPMHPEVVKPRAGACDQCGMDLVTAESLGFASRETPAERVLAAPKTAVLLTGRRAVVYVESHHEGEPVYEGRVVELGPRAGDWYVVLSGLSAGERVVTRGALMIDSALQIEARPSMMQPESGSSEPAAEKPEPPPRAIPGAAYHASARPVIEAYLELSAALAADDGPKSTRAALALREAAGAARPDGLADSDAEHFAALMMRVKDGLPADADAGIEGLRNTLPALTTTLEEYVRTFGHDRDAPLHRIHCPMAFDNRGASWLSADSAVRNPYFGAKMFRCGVAQRSIAADGREAR